MVRRRSRARPLSLPTHRASPVLTRLGLLLHHLDRHILACLPADARGCTQGGVGSTAAGIRAWGGVWARAPSAQQGGFQRSLQLFGPAGSDLGRAARRRGAPATAARGRSWGAQRTHLACAAGRHIAIHTDTHSSLTPAESPLTLNLAQHHVVLLRKVVRLHQLLVAEEGVLPEGKDQAEALRAPPGRPCGSTAGTAAAGTARQRPSPRALHLSRHARRPWALPCARMPPAHR